MIKEIDKKYCQDNLIQMRPKFNDNDIILDNKEILLLVTNKNVIINKYLDNLKNSKMIFETNKQYLQISSKDGSLSIKEHYFINKMDKTFHVSSTNSDGINAAKVYNREELKEQFELQKDIDAMYIIDANGNVLCAKNKIDGNIINDFSMDDVIENKSNIELSHLMVISKKGKLEMKFFGIQTTNGENLILRTKRMKMSNDDIYDMSKVTTIENVKLMDPIGTNNNGISRSYPKVLQKRRIKSKS